MRSRAHFKAHPLHPALIPFPFAFLAGAAVFDLAALFGSARLSVTAADLTLAGIGAGFLAAVPGAIDYFYSVPPGSSGRARATRHAIGNVVALALFAIAFAVRHPDWTASAATVCLQAAGLGVLGYAGWLGGTLVTRNLISVDHRYADRGKWSEASFSGVRGQEIVVAGEADLQDGHLKLLHVDGRRLVLARVDGRYHAIEDRCTHRGGSLAAGVLVGNTVHCLWHGSQFDVRSGAVVCGPAADGVQSCPVRQADGKVFLRVP